MGTVISLTGTNLAGTTAITFMDTSGNVVTTGFTVASASSIMGIVVPAGASTGTLTVTTPAGTSAASPGTFTITILLPTITAVSPAAELPGLPVTLTGTNFPAGNTVSFGGTAASGVTVTSPTSLTVIVPAGIAAGSAAVVVGTVGAAAPARPSRP